MKHANITFIGCGNMGASLIGGLIKNAYPKQALKGADNSPDQRSKIEQDYNIATFGDNTTACEGADVIVIALKPQILLETIKSLATLVQTQKSLIISIAAGIPVRCLNQALGEDAAVIRVMPNTPSLIQTGTSGLFANQYVSDQQKQLAETILNTVGISLWLDKEELIDAVTAISGSGPAYYFLFMEAMEKAAIDLGLNKQQAHALTLQTALGAAMMAKHSPEDIAVLRQQVTSPGGTTEAALNSFRGNNFEGLIHQAILCARDRAIEMAKLFSEEKDS